MEQRSRRLRLVPATAESVEAEMADPVQLGRLIRAEVPEDWPPETLREALPRFHQWHREHPEWAGWLEWYGVRLDLAAPVLCGSAGFHGPPDDRGVVEIGYSVLPDHRRRGLATEMVAALVWWARSQPAVSRVEAETTIDNPASIRVLEHIGFRLVGSSYQTASVRYCLP